MFMRMKSSVEESDNSEREVNILPTNNHGNKQCLTDFTEKWSSNTDDTKLPTKHKNHATELNNEAQIH